MTNANQLERVRYWQGQLLAAGDLQTQMRVVAELRRQHNRAVHSAYGIAIGLSAGDIAARPERFPAGLSRSDSPRPAPKRPCWSRRARPSSRRLTRLRATRDRR